MLHKEKSTYPLTGKHTVKSSKPIDLSNFSKRYSLFQSFKYTFLVLILKHYFVFIAVIWLLISRILMICMRLCLPLWSMTQFIIYVLTAYVYRWYFTMVTQLLYL